MKWMRGTLVIALLLVAGIVGYRLLRPPRAAEVRASLVGTSGATADLSGFARATEPGGLSFPDAFGPHPDFQTEWWYYTGNLQTAAGRPFGFQFTIFRRSLVPGEPERASAFGANSVYMAHFTVTDGAAGQFYDNERFQRGGGGVAGATAAPYSVWLDDWRVEEVAPGRYRMQAQAEQVAIALTMESLKPPVLHGNQGLSQKSAEPGNASYYYSQTRLATEGTVTVNGQRYEVSGLSWKDHEYSTSALGEGTVGWDWFALQLSDGRELMYYQLRRADGGVEPETSGSFILEDGSVRPLTREDVQVEVLATWRSPESGGVYPAGWRLTIPSEGIELVVEPLVADQELNVSVTYWEGAVTVEGTVAGQPVTGRGYVELTGYGGERVPTL